MNWWPLLLGWPALLAAIALAGFGTFNRHAWKLYVAALLISPLSLYLAGTPRISWYGLLPPLALVAAGIAISKNRPNIAWAMLLPVILFFGWLFYVVQEAGGWL